MYPYLRMLKVLWDIRKQPALGLFETHESKHRVWPQDLDPWLELNNGRTLTLYDLGRIPLALRSGVNSTMRKHSWGLTVAGSSIRYRRRVRLFETVLMKSRFIGWDDRFFYMHQSMWREEECTSHMLLRTAFVERAKGRSGIVTPETVVKALGVLEKSPPLPEWVQAWIEAETKRPWPPQH